MMRLTLATGPASEPISTADAKAHLRVDHSDDDSYIDLLVEAAREYVESVTRRALITQTWDYYLDRFPPRIELPRPPLRSVGSITYVDVDGNSQTLATGVYTVDTDSEPGQVYEAYDQSWPSTRDVDKAVQVTYDAGYGAAAAVPEAIIHAMKLLIQIEYDGITGEDAETMRRRIDSLLAPYRVHSF